MKYYYSKLIFDLISWHIRYNAFKHQISHKLININLIELNPHLFKQLMNNFLIKPSSLKIELEISYSLQNWWNQLQPIEQFDKNKSTQQTKKKSNEARKGKSSN